MSPWIAFGLGMAGALAPEVVRLYNIRTEPEKFIWSWFYVVASVLFMALGGLLALILPATTYWGALYVGVSTPVVISSVARNAQRAPGMEMRSPRAPSRVPVASSPSARSFLEGLR